MRERLKKIFGERKYNAKLLLIPVAVIVALLLYRYKGVFVAATVNGKPISRYSVLKELEKEGGKTVLDNLITNNLILQEAQKEKVTASNDEINTQIDQITTNLKAQGTDLNTALAAQGMTQQDLKDQIKLKVLVNKMATKDIAVSDKEIEDYFNQNKSTYPKNAKIADYKSQIQDTLKQQKSSQAIQDWVTSLKSKAKINYFVSY